MTRQQVRELVEIAVITAITCAALLWGIGASIGGL